jgi:hypothetical protein
MSTNNFQFIRQKYNNKTNVWYNKIFIGSVEAIIKENPNIDWPALRADKTLRLKHEDRWLCTWKALSSLDINSLGIFDSKIEAAQAILDAHEKKFSIEIKNDSIN